MGTPDLIPDEPRWYLYHRGSAGLCWTCTWRGLVGIVFHRDAQLRLGFGVRLEGRLERFELMRRYRLSHFPRLGEDFAPLRQFMIDTHESLQHLFARGYL